MAVVSAGFTNGYGHPRREVIERLFPFTETVPSHKLRWAELSGGTPKYTFTTFNADEAIYCTSVNGNIVITSDGNLFDVAFNR